MNKIKTPFAASSTKLSINMDIEKPIQYFNCGKNKMHPPAFRTALTVFPPHLGDDLFGDADTVSDLGVRESQPLGRQQILGAEPLVSRHAASVLYKWTTPYPVTTC